MKRICSFFVLGSTIFSVAWLLSGCGVNNPPPVAVAPPGVERPTGIARHDQEEHGHAKGIQAMGDYHAKVLVEKGGDLRLLILGKDETKEAAIEVQEIRGHLQIVDEAEGVAVTLKAEPQTGDPAGKTSQFVGKLPENLRGKPLVATFRIVINGEAYRPSFETVPGTSRRDDHSPMPKGVVRGGEPTAEENALYLTPGGIYTASDIAANGTTTASTKFKGKMAAHVMDPKPGDRICPITETKANPNFSWVIGGKTYEFCCPPCVDEFVKMAKEQPAKIKAPEAYVK